MPISARCIQNAAQSGGQGPCRAHVHRIAGGCGGSLRRFPCAVFCTQPDDSISVHAVMHRRRNLRALDDRLKTLELRAHPLQCRAQISVNSRRDVGTSMPDSSPPAFRSPACFLRRGGPAPHVERLDPARRRRFDRLEIFLANQEIVLHHPAEGVERKQKGRTGAFASPRRYRENKALLRNRDAEACKGRAGH